MATLEKFKRDDIATTRNMLHEAIPITGSLLTGSTPFDEANIKNFDHGMFQSVYDYSYLSSSANHIFDLTAGVYSASGDTTEQNAKKHNIYQEMAQVLYGFDATASVHPFRQSGSYTDGDVTINRPIFLNLSRLMTKDEIQKNTFRLQFGTGAIGLDPQAGGVFAGAGGTAPTTITIGDYGADTTYNDSNSPAGEFGVLRIDSSTGHAVGILYYQAGVAVLDISQSLTMTDSTASWVSQSGGEEGNHLSYDDAFDQSTIQVLADSFRRRVYNLEFNNTTELNSTIYFCRAHNNQFNYSSNPTYLSSSQIIVKENNSDNAPFAYITTVGLYSEDNALMGVAKLSEPIKKTPSTEFTLRVRLDY
tara:strand:+ start:6422 stop:7507 length:1086 start_codon:yes stop_codon:yes gene_type:complete